MSRRRKFDPLIVIETERLTLRQAQFRQAAAIAKFWREEAKFLEPFEPTPKTSERTTVAYWRERLKEDRLKSRRREALRFFLFEKTATPRLCGMIHFSNVVGGAFQASHLGYLLAESAQGKGLMTEALRAAIDFAFGPWNLHRVMANHLPGNGRSAAVLKRLGFVTEGTAKDYLRIAGKWQDHVLTSLTNPNWRER